MDTMPVKVRPRPHENFIVLSAETGINEYITAWININECMNID